LNTREDLHQSAFASTVFANEPKDLTGQDMQTHPRQSGYARIGLADVLNPQYWFHHPLAFETD
jgi:hypothetical protein